MKALNYLNYFMVGFPLAMILVGLLFDDGLWACGLLFTMLTGGFQVIVGIGMFIDDGCRNKYVGIYLITVAIFFVLWIVADWNWIFVLPPLLALYMSVLLYVEAKKEKHEPQSNSL